jgi:hypothetical protein
MNAQLPAREGHVHSPSALRLCTCDVSSYSSLQFKHAAWREPYVSTSSAAAVICVFGAAGQGSQSHGVLHAYMFVLYIGKKPSREYRRYEPACDSRLRTPVTPCGWKRLVVHTVWRFELQWFLPRLVVWRGSARGGRSESGAPFIVLYCTVRVHC